MEGKIVYFEKIGRENTEEVLRIARERAEELGIKTILVASTYGDTAARAVEVFEGFRVVAVTHANGIREPNTQQFSEENRRKVESKGGIILTTTHALAGVNRAIRQKFATNTAVEIVAQALHIFGAGMKVVCAITMMAADAGLVGTDEDVIVITGSGRGADTAVVLKPVNSQNFFDLRVQEILCKPHLAVASQRSEVAAGERRHHS